MSAFCLIMGSDVLPLRTMNETRNEVELHAVHELMNEKNGGT
jgi:hypothetical protein